MIQILVNLLFVVGYSADHYSADHYSAGVFPHTKRGFNALMEVVSDHTIPYWFATNDLSVRGIQLGNPIRMEKRNVHPLRGPFFKTIPRTLVV